MHDYDRTSLELGFGDYESDEYGYEFEGDPESYGETYGESPFNEAEEMELAAELLSVNSEAELDQFIGKLFKKAGRAIGKFVKSPIGKTLGGIVKGVVKQALPVVGNALLPGVGGVLGSVVASGIGGGAAGAPDDSGQPAAADPGEILGLELEGLSAEDQEFEAAKQLIKFAGAAANHAAQAASSINPARAAQSAAIAAAKLFAPGLLRETGPAKHAKNGPPQHRKHPHTGNWVRRGSTIILYGV